MTTNTLNAREISQLAQNPDCKRRLSILANGLSTDDLAKKIGLTMLSEMSIFQQMVGVKFEVELFKNSCEKLFKHFVDSGSINCANNGIVDLRDLFEEPHSEDVEKTQLKVLSEETKKLLLRRVLGESETLILGSVLELNYAGFKAFIKPDFLIAFEGERFYRIGEIKSFQYVRELTDKSATTKAFSQMAVEYLSLFRTYQQLFELESQLKNIPFSEETLGKKGELIVRTKSMKSKHITHLIRPDLQFLLDSEQTIIKNTQQDTLVKYDSNEILDNSFFESISPSICDECESMCALASHCRNSGYIQFNPESIGDDFSDLCGPLKLSEALSLLANPPENMSRYQKEVLEVLENDYTHVVKSNGFQTFEDLKESHGERP